MGKREKDVEGKGERERERMNPEQRKWAETIMPIHQIPTQSTIRNTIQNRYQKQEKKKGEARKGRKKREEKKKKGEDKEGP